MTLKPRLVVQVAEQRRILRPGQSLTFGRDRSCQICLDRGDIGISRIAGQVADRDGLWAVTNLSHKRALHIVDSTGFAVPLPITPQHGPPSRRAVDQPELTVLIVGDSWTHALILRPDPPPALSTNHPAAPMDPISTRTQVPHLTDRRKEAMVALARGYLRPYPHYDPRPLTYQEVADLLGVTKSQVTKRIEHIRENLVESGVPGLEKEIDARRPLCEWMLAMRVITPKDLDWLTEQIKTPHGR